MIIVGKALEKREADGKHLRLTILTCILPEI
jgi:hypothetical protein